MFDSTLNFCVNDQFNANFDITWSFQFNVSGSNRATGGFSTFLFDSPILAGGGNYSGYGFAPYKTQSGVGGAALGIIFDSTNVITIKNSTFQNITSFPLFSSISPLVSANSKFNTIRFNLTDVGNTLKIALKDEIENTYTTVASISTGLVPNDNTFYKIGFSYVSPIKSGDDKFVLNLKNIHCHGKTEIPTTILVTSPLMNISFNDPLYGSSGYLVQTPLSGKINIHGTLNSGSVGTVGSIIYNK